MSLDELIPFFAFLLFLLTIVNSSFVAMQDFSIICSEVYLMIALILVIVAEMMTMKNRLIDDGIHGRW